MSATTRPTSGKIFGFNADRDAIVQDVVARELSKKTVSEAAMELALNDTALHELARLEGSGKEERWRDLHRTLGRKGPQEKRELLHGLLDEHARDIVGNFDARVYRFATGMVPYGMSVLLRPKEQLADVEGGLAARFRTQGHIDTLKSLAARGTVILVPTHSSNLDSLVIGYALHQLGLPPFTYGAGKNLFTNFLLSFFMNNLGAYKVDRRLTFGLYKDVLKTYSTVLLERGYHSLFFPGGGRCRSNAIESKLKLGLMGTGLAAYINNLKAQRPADRIFVVPATLNYQLVLEAETLIDDQLQRVGKSRYIIEDDESAQAGRIWSFVQQMLELDTSITVQFGTALDPFGNRVEADGESYDTRGRRIALEKYVEIQGAPEHDAARDAEYTRELATAVTEGYRQNLVVASTMLVAFALYRLIQARNPGLDLFRLLREGEDATLPLSEVYPAVERVRSALRLMAADGKVVLSPRLQSDRVEELVANAIRVFGMYHRKAVAVRQGDEVRLTDMKLLLYYHNRLTGYGLERVLMTEVRA